MSVYLQINADGDQFQIASNSGWGDVLRWSEKLDAKKFPAATKALDEGFAENARELRGELARAVKESPPKKADVLSTLRGLLRALRAAGDDDVICFTNGIMNE